MGTEDFTMADVISEKKAVLRYATIQTNGEIANQIAEAKQELQDAERFDARNNVNPTAPAAQEKLDKLLESAKATERVFSFKSIGRNAYDELVSEHPPTQEQKDDPDPQIARAGYNVNTFPPAIIAAASHKPKISPEQAASLWDDPNWNGVELLRLFFAAMEANTESGDTPLSGRGSDLTTNLLSNLVTQLASESPTPST